MSNIIFYHECTATRRSRRHNCMTKSSRGLVSAGPLGGKWWIAWEEEAQATAIRTMGGEAVQSGRERRGISSGSHGARSLVERLFWRRRRGVKNSGRARPTGTCAQLKRMRTTPGETWCGDLGRRGRAPWPKRACAESKQILSQRPQKEAAISHLRSSYIRLQSHWEMHEFE